MHPQNHEIIERDAVQWWKPSTFRGAPINNQKDVQDAAMSMVGEVLSAIRDILHDGTAKPSERLQAANMVLDRALGKATQEVKIEATYTPPELIGDQLLEMLNEAKQRLEEKEYIDI